ncbi:trypsin-like serine protease [Actinacidiphila glaucinigra]|uniref:trypsin-like serine protease n=1 Tax=Actinacidiphila glaucinigra TaxID=235986 RepID=UPI0033A26164
MALTATPTQAVTGPATTDTSYAFTARLEIGADANRACSGALVDPEWLLTAASCFANNPATGFDVPAGAPALPTTATIGRTDVTTTTGQVRNVVALVPHPDQDLVLAKLASPVTGITPIALSTSAPAAGEELRVAGYGRTAEEWVPLKLHTGTFTVDSADSSKVSITGQDDAAVCKGDTGGPLLRGAGATVQLVGIHSRSWQGGCFESDPAETRSGAVDTRVDTVRTWISTAVAASTPAPRHDYTDNGTPDVLARDTTGQLWLEDTRYDTVNKALTTTARRLIGPGWSGYTMIEAAGDIGGSAAGDLVARDASGVLWFYEGRGDGTFASRTKIGPGWSGYNDLAGGGDLTGDGKADLVATDSDGALWLYKGTGDSVAPYAARVKVGLAGWTSFHELNLTGNIAGSPASDLIARDTTGMLWLFEGKGDGTFLPRTEIGPNWDQYTQITSIGDGNGDGKPDLYAFSPNGKMYFYAGTGNEASPFSTRSATTVLTANWQLYNLVS